MRFHNENMKNEVSIALQAHLSWLHLLLSMPYSETISFLSVNLTTFFTPSPNKFIISFSRLFLLPKGTVNYTTREHLHYKLQVNWPRGWRASARASDAECWTHQCWPELSPGQTCVAQCDRLSVCTPGSNTKTQLHSSTCRVPQKGFFRFPGLCHSPAMFRYKYKQQLLTLYKRSGTILVERDGQKKKVVASVLASINKLIYVGPG